MTVQLIRKNIAETMTKAMMMPSHAIASVFIL